MSVSRDESKFLHIYTVYAEAPIDVGGLLEHVLVWDMTYLWNGPGFGCEITFTSEWDRDAVLAGLYKIVDGHSMVRSLKKV